MRVLYVNHTALISGAEQSLLVLLRSMAGVVTPLLACPEGPLATEVRALGIEVHPIPGTSLSARLHPVHTSREGARVIGAARSLRAIARRLRVDLVHANTPRAGLMAVFARGRAGAAPVIHVRDSIPPGRLPRLMFRLLAPRVSAFIPTSQYLADQLPASRPTPVIANAIESSRFDPMVADGAAARRVLGLDAATPVITVVGQISPHKGQSDAIRILALVRDAHPDAQLLLAGSVKFAGAATRFDNRAYENDLHRLTAELGVHDATKFLGERSDVAGIIAATDVLLVPSWYEPFGRVALEAMMMAKPVVATSVGGTKEVVTDGVDGVVLAPRQPEKWAETVISLLDDRDRMTAMGGHGRRRALRDFTPEAHALQVLAVYERALA